MIFCSCQAHTNCCETIKEISSITCLSEYTVNLHLTECSEQTFQVKTSFYRAVVFLIVSNVLKVQTLFRDNLHTALTSDIKSCKMDSWFPFSEYLAFFFKGHFYDSASVAFPLNSSTKGHTTQREALMEKRSRE